MIELLNRKEMALYTQSNEMRAMQKSFAMGAAASSASRSEVPVPASDADQDTLRLFREKAIQMYEKLKAITEQNENLKKELLLARGRLSGGTELESSTTIRSNTEDLEKKLDRVQKSFEAEKAKTSALLERALNAEKDSQGSAHLITDLEAKVEHTLKTSMQYKKEIDSMKQKMVQADAEKNKVKNELLKAQAQIQTLMKRAA
jgi:chromosome segregation ATPase